MKLNSFQKLCLKLAQFNYRHSINNKLINNILFNIVNK